jgi:flagellar hook protein FlgE
MPNFSIPLSGLDASSAALSTAANNLANLNTIGYKDQQIQFADLFYQNLGSDGAGDPIQQGAGVEVGSQPSDFTQGDVTSTGIDTDVAINGNGFFVVQQNGVESYTRAGNFEVGTNNLLETSDGQQVLGYQAVNGVVNNSQGLGTLALGSGAISPATVTTNVSLTSNLDATAAVGSSYSTQATIYDSLGGGHNITFTYTKTATNTWTYNATIPAADISGATAPVSVGTGTLAFNGDGTLASPTSNPTIKVPPVPVQAVPPAVPPIPQSTFADGANQLTFTWNLASASGTGLLTQLASPNSTSAIQQDGTSSGTLQNFSIGSDGTITGSFSNGTTATLGQIALASFADEQGLSRNGDNDFSPTLASGQPTVGAPISGGLGSISGGALEQSNVDIATEFANLIVAQRTYEANARVVTTFDTIAQDTIALKQ